MRWFENFILVSIIIKSTPHYSSSLPAMPGYARVIFIRKKTLVSFKINANLAVIASRLILGD
jgi:hypothetical protein